MTSIFANSRPSAFESDFFLLKGKSRFDIEHIVKVQLETDRVERPLEKAYLYVARPRKVKLLQSPNTRL